MAESQTTSTDSKPRRPKWRGQQIEHKNRRLQGRRQERENTQGFSHGDDEYGTIDSPVDVSMTNTENQNRGLEGRSSKLKAFSRPSVIQIGDKGIFVTADKGKEKRSLDEVANLIEEYLEMRGLLQQPHNNNSNEEARQDTDHDDEVDDIDVDDIESNILSELASMRSASSSRPTNSSHPQQSTTTPRLFQLITLDIPCVSFVRFHPSHPSYRQLNPVTIVHDVCTSAYRQPGQMRSRFIKRLSPVVYLGKILNEGLKKCCDVVLPSHFGSDAGMEDIHIAEQPNRLGEDANEANRAKRTMLTYAIKPVIRNSAHLSRDELIRYVADEVKRLNSRYTVDLTGYQKGILVEIYRGYVAMSVVENGDGTAIDDKNDSSSSDMLGYERHLKKYNLAEIYAEGLKRMEET